MVDKLKGTNINCFCGEPSKNEGTRTIKKYSEPTEPEIQWEGM